MSIDFTPEEREQLVQLLEARIHELGPEIRRSRNSRFHDELQEQQRKLQRLLHRLHESAWDVTA